MLSDVFSTTEFSITLYHFLQEFRVAQDNLRVVKLNVPTHIMMKSAEKSGFEKPLKCDRKEMERNDVSSAVLSFYLKICQGSHSTQYTRHEKVFAVFSLVYYEHLTRVHISEKGVFLTASTYIMYNVVSLLLEYTLIWCFYELTPYSCS